MAANPEDAPESVKIGGTLLTTVGRRSAALDAEDTVLDLLLRESLVEDGPARPRHALPAEIPGWPPWRNRLRSIFRFPWRSKAGRVYSAFSNLIILLAVLTMILETVPSLRWPGKKSAEVFFILDLTWTVLFTVELLVNCSVMASWREFFSWWTLVDFLSCVPFYATLIIAAATSSSDYAKNVPLADGLRLLRLFRIIRLVKIAQHNVTIRLLWIALWQSRQGVIALLVGIPLLTIFFGTATYYLESFACYMNDQGEWVYYTSGQVSSFQSAIDGIWLSIETISTVGYGDMVPQTWQGRSLTYVEIVLAMIIVAFPLTIISSSYSTVFEQYRLRAKALRDARNGTLKHVEPNALNGSKPEPTPDCEAKPPPFPASMDIRLHLSSAADWAAATRFLLDLQASTGIRCELSGPAAPLLPGDATFPGP
ncbi:hypothetical protein DFJ74DRAFT_479055 [Hyaloraphidium curvatum]|nr:hypothetical protein DFJ74DRAFT_479055 [Hyaloraphidium curvatum]